jgi:hypothetical protein
MIVSGKEFKPMVESDTSVFGVFTPRYYVSDTHTLCSVFYGWEAWANDWADTHTFVWGCGATPEEALKDLERKTTNHCPECGGSGPATGLGGLSGYEGPCHGGPYV